MARDRLRGVKTPTHETEPVLPSSPPMAKLKSRNSSLGKVPGADTPKPECRARTSHSPDRLQKYVLPLHRLELFLPNYFQRPQKNPAPVRNPTLLSAQTSDRLPHRESDPTACGSAFQLAQPMTLDRDNQLECIC